MPVTHGIPYVYACVRAAEHAQQALTSDHAHAHLRFPLRKGTLAEGSHASRECTRAASGIPHPEQSPCTAPSALHALHVTAAPTFAWLLPPRSIPCACVNMLSRHSGSSCPRFYHCSVHTGERTPARTASRGHQEAFRGPRSRRWPRGSVHTPLTPEAVHTPLTPEALCTHR